MGVSINVNHVRFNEKNKNLKLKRHLRYIFMEKKNGKNFVKCLIPAGSLYIVNLLLPRTQTNTVVEASVPVKVYKITANPTI